MAGHSERPSVASRGRAENNSVVVGPDMEIYDIVARWPGSAHDSRIFRCSKLYSRLNTAIARFACLHKGLSNKLSTNANVIVACAVLHNIAKSFGDDYESDNEDELTQILTSGEIPVQATRHSAEGVAFRDSIVNTFYT
ncbi:hypothetical protein EVAR_85494_1 [Eumeta japonica]|uniref:Nuclease HARBI1 n=1 Tax=Eumeta variegata TaxID=151549 RepID=A0A4C1VDA0_EUMVA|nr:hypothetical protein EVAR_85494_1 [Eumeta japonica]